MSEVGELPNKPCLVQHGRLRFLVTDSPADELMPLYVRAFERAGVRDVVCVADVAYDPAPLAAAGMRHHALPYDDGTAPPDHVISAWLALCAEVFGAKKKPSTEAAATAAENCVAVHCAAGLGRAPVMVVIALIELEGLQALEAVSVVRGACRGAINQVQLRYFKSYKRRTKLSHSGGDCSLQ